MDRAQKKRIKSEKEKIKETLEKHCRGISKDVLREYPNIYKTLYPVKHREVKVEKEEAQSFSTTDSRTIQ